MDFNHRKHFAVFVLFTLFFLMMSFFIINSEGHFGVKLFSSSIRPIYKHDYRQVCQSNETKIANCFAEISIGIDGRPLIVNPSSSSSYGPLQFHTAYNLPCTPGSTVAAICQTPTTFGPQTIAIVDAGSFSSGNSGLESSLAAYDSYYGIASCSISDGCLSVVNQSGSTSPLPADAGWSDEIALDVETAHMICQTCKILLVEANDATGNNLAISNLTASTFNPVSISNSWGSSSDIPSLDSYFKYSNIADIAATGDNGTVSVGAAWPSDIPEVIGVSGTTLTLNTDNTWNSETVWNGSGGGCSNYYSAPSWQSSLSNWSTNGCGTYRSFADISADGDPNTGAAINVDGTWYQVGGTSLSAPIIAGIYGLSSGINSSNQVVDNLYLNYNSSNFHDIVTGNDCLSSGQPHCTASVGFDTPSGLGSPNGMNAFLTLPTNPINPVATDINQNSIELSWSINGSVSNVAGYYVYRNGQKIATVTTTDYLDSNLTPNTTYNYYIVAFNASNVLSSASLTVTAITSYPADINQDGHINILDLSLLASKYGQSGSNIGRIDINQDGTVNILDLSILAGQYGSE